MNTSIKVMLCWYGLVVFALGGSMALAFQKHGSSAQRRQTRVVVLCASVGKAWQLEEWPARVRDERYRVETVPVYRFDKSDDLRAILARPHLRFRPDRAFLRQLLERPLKPDVLIIKECAAYFPADLARYTRLIRSWAAACRTAGVVPVLATVSPVTAPKAKQRPGRQESIERYNDWLRAFADLNGIACLDIERCLRVSGTCRLLRPELAQADGLHLNAEAYALLDAALRETLLAVPAPEDRP